MTNTLTHRGPDDYGYAFVGPDSDYFWREDTPEALNGKGVAFGHRRLSIIDLSIAGRQPFFSQDRQLSMVFNGEIFNYVELREDLKRAGYRFHTNTDTEVLLNAFEHWGNDAFNRLNGMWAVVFWNNRTKQLTACRDRFGIKPLFFSRLGDDWVFASEVKAILAHPQSRAAPNASSVLHFMHSLFKPDLGVTFFEGIDELEPGHFLSIGNGHMEKHRYWDFPKTGHAGKGSLSDNIEELRHLVDDAVKLRLRSDAKIGTMLSGGIDSTSIISTVDGFLSADQQSRPFVGEQIQAYHASFPEQWFDEKENVDIICKELNLDPHYVFPLVEENVVDLYESALHHMESPFHNSVPLVHTLLMRKAKCTGVKVVLNGHGADEMFAGYPDDYIHYALHEMFSNLNWISAVRHLNGFHSNYGVSRLQLLKDTLKLNTTGLFSAGNNHQVDPLFRQDALATYFEDDEQCAFRNKLDQVLKRDFSRRLLPNWLHMEDRISMGSSIEARTPFLDYRLVEFAFSLKASTKTHQGIPKYILRQAMSDRLPPIISDDKRKVRFSGPEKQWLKNPLKALMVEVLVSPDTKVVEWLDKDLLEKRLQAFLKEEKTPYAGLMWRLFNTEMWLRKFTG